VIERVQTERKQGGQEVSRFKLHIGGVGGIILWR